MNQSSTTNQPDTVLLVENFGRQTPVHDAVHPINDDEEDFHSVFYARSVLMSWHTTLMGKNRYMAWDMHEAEHIVSMNAPNDAVSCIGFAQVGLRPQPDEIVLRIPAVVQCLHDSLIRFGRIELSAVQITATSLPTGAPNSLIDLICATNWFNNVNDTPAQALITFDDQSLPQGRSDPFVPLRNASSSQFFTFGALTAVPDIHGAATFEARPRPITPRLSEIGLPVTMPNWTLGSIGWTLAAVLHATLTASPGLREIFIGITRS